MANPQNDVFADEKELLKKAKNLLKEAENNTIPIAEFEELVKSYSFLLKQNTQLTRFSDKNQKRMKQILERLSRYVSPQLCRKITSGKELVEINKTRRVKLTIFYSDIKGFSWHSSNMEGESLSAILNSYLEEMTIIVAKHRGSLDKYIGDAIMVFFGDPVFTTDQDHAQRCVMMALEMQERMKQLQDYWFQLGYSDPLHIRMGISTGYVSVGNFGSSERMDYTIIGSAVNLAARLQEAAEEDQILISHETWALVKDLVECAEASTYELKGFYQPILAHPVKSVVPNQVETNLHTIEDKESELLIKFDPTKISKDDIIKMLQDHNPEGKS
ncbi:adenylate/guanylate cyclase domain-containing protein [bacterium]|nr:adenylate/guanylate cyclase domain-containing protein [bacterium]